MGDILQASDYGAIRTKIGVSASKLADSDIEALSLLPMAEALVELGIPTFQTILSGSDQGQITILKNATISLCAALAVAGLNMKSGQGFRLSDYQETATTFNFGEAYTRFMTEAHMLMSLLNRANAKPQTLFVVTGPTSSAAIWPRKFQQWQARVYPHLLQWLTNTGNIQFSWEVQP